MGEIIHRCHFHCCIRGTSEIWGPVSFSPQVLWVYIYMETCSVSVSKYQDMLFTSGQHKWVREKKKYSFCIKLFSFLLRAAAATCPDRLNCVTDRSRGLWACQGHRRATHPILLPPAVTMSHKAQQARLVTRVPPLVPSKWDGGRQQKTTRIAGYGSVHKSQSRYLDIETWTWKQHCMRWRTGK